MLIINIFALYIGKWAATWLCLVVPGRLMPGASMSFQVSNNINQLLLFHSIPLQHLNNFPLFLVLGVMHHQAVSTPTRTCSCLSWAQPQLMTFTLVRTRGGEPSTMIDYLFCTEIYSQLFLSFLLYFFPLWTGTRAALAGGTTTISNLIILTVQIIKKDI